MAERVGFEPTVGFLLHSLSRRALSTAQTPLRSVIHRNRGLRGPAIRCARAQWLVHAPSDETDREQSSNRCSSRVAQCGLTREFAAGEYHLRIRCYLF